MWLSLCMIIVGIFVVVREVHVQQELQRPTCLPYNISQKKITIADIRFKVKCFHNSGKARVFFKPVLFNSDHLKFSCGMRMSTASIISGKEAIPHFWPWQALMFVAILRQGERKNLICGGTIISNQWVVTAAHCTPRDMFGIRVILGVHNYKEYGNTVKEIRLTVSDIHVHPKYDARAPIGQTPDITLIKFPEYVHFNDYIQPACLPETGEQLPKQCVTMGWGKSVDYESPINSHKLKEIMVSVEQCSDFPAYYCAWTTEDVKSGVCSGDSGGPLLCEREGAYFVTGIVSHSSNSCDQRKNHYAGLYTNVTGYMKWIKEMMINVE